MHLNKATPSENIRKARTAILFGLRFPVTTVSGTDRNLLNWVQLPAQMCKPMQNPGTFQGNKQISYQGAGPSYEITLTAIYSYSYRADRVVSAGVL
jgi:hypothetical protein